MIHAPSITAHIPLLSDVRVTHANFTASQVRMRKLSVLPRWSLRYLPLKLNVDDQDTPYSVICRYDAKSLGTLRPSDDFSISSTNFLNMQAQTTI